MALELKYFVLKPGGNNLFALASRVAMFEFANIIKAEDQELARSLFDWVRREDQSTDRAEQQSRGTPESESK